MAAGAVPVASHLPGVADVVGNEGYTFKPGASTDLRQILLRLHDDAGLRQHMASLAQQKARLYSWERTVFGYERIFTQLVQSGNTRPLPLAPAPVQVTRYGK
jgi:glycosyltransferase involved in cell wall biosynthesis